MRGIAVAAGIAAVQGGFGETIRHGRGKEGKVGRTAVSRRTSYHAFFTLRFSDIRGCLAFGFQHSGEPDFFCIFIFFF